MLNLVALESSNAASTSSSKQKGAGLSKKKAKINVAAAIDFSPPESDCIDIVFFPGKRASMAMPAVRMSSSRRTRAACPPPNILGNKNFKF